MRVCAALSDDENDLYFIQNPASCNIKVGRTRDIGGRLRALEYAGGGPLTLLAIVPGGGRLEAELHAALRETRLMGEWFAPSADLRALTADPSSVLRFVNRSRARRRRQSIADSPATAPFTHPYGGFL